MLEKGAGLSEKEVDGGRKILHWGGGGGQRGFAAASRKLERGKKGNARTKTFQRRGEGGGRSRMAIAYLYGGEGGTRKGLRKVLRRESEEGGAPASLIYVREGERGSA